MRSREAAEADLKSKLEVWRSMGATSENQVNLATARNVWEEEMGRHGEHEIDYSLSQKTRDTLLSHGRQDAAHTLLNTTSILNATTKLSKQISALQSLALIIIFMLGAALLKLYPTFFLRR